MGTVAAHCNVSIQKRRSSVWLGLMGHLSCSQNNPVLRGGAGGIWILGPEGCEHLQIGLPVQLTGLSFVS